MCGLAGVLGRDVSRINDQMFDELHDLQVHRGPDGSGDSGWFDLGGANCRLIHQRLAIIDLSDGGAQPMSSADGNFTLVFNGELYNYIELKRVCENLGYRFKSSSDTEVALATLEVFGVNKAQEQWVGMWAFALADRAGGRLYLSRDRAGEKPLYYHFDSDNLFFASEIKAVLHASDKRFEVNEKELAAYLIRSQRATTCETFFDDIFSVEAGTTTSFEFHDERLNSRSTRYWSPRVSYDGPESIIEFSNLVKQELITSVDQQLRSDVPVGLLLSGGLDSSAIAASCRELGKLDNVSLMTSVSDNPKYDESSFARSCAAYLGADLTEIKLDSRLDEVESLMRRLTWHFDSPLGSLSNVTHSLLMEKARDAGVTVILSGQAADELFCGYRKFVGFRFLDLLQRRKILQATGFIGGFALNRSIVNQIEISEMVRYWPGLRRKRSGQDVYSKHLLSQAIPDIGLGSKGFQARQIADFEKYSLPALCHFEDRSSMASSREIRLPFLARPLVDLALSAPIPFKMSNGWTKYALRLAMQGLLPEEIVWRKDKKGFVNPQEVWLKRELRGLVEKYLFENSMLEQLGYLNRDGFIAMYEQFVSGKDGNSISFKEIFAPLAAEIWLQEFKGYIK